MRTEPEVTSQLPLNNRETHLWTKLFGYLANPREIRTAVPRRKNSRLVAAKRNYNGGIECRVRHRPSITTVGKFAKSKEQWHGWKKGERKGEGEERLSVALPSPLCFRIFMLSPRYPTYRKLAA